MSENVKPENVIKIDPASFKPLPLVMASSDAKPDAKPDEIQISKDDLDQLAEKIRAEESSLRQVAEMQLLLSRMGGQMESAVKAAEGAKEDRDKLCKEVEQRYKVPKGASWGLNLEKGTIFIRRPAFTG
jgi:hypothetical protein